MGMLIATSTPVLLRTLVIVVKVWKRPETLDFAGFSRGRDLQLLVRRILRTGKEPRNGPVSDDFERNSYGFFELLIVVAVGWNGL